MIITLLLIAILPILAVAAGLAVFAAWTAWRVEVAVPPIGRFLTVRGVRLHYVDQGDGPALLMIHGLASQLQSFTFALAACLPGFRLIMVDRPGCGYSQAAPTATFAEQAALMAALLRALGVPRALVVGHSLGGAIALVLAMDHPDVVAGVALLAPAAHVPRDPPKALRGLAIRFDLVRWIVAWTVAIPSSLRASAPIRAALFGPDPVPEDFGTRGGHLLPLRPWTFRNASRDMMAAMKSGYHAQHYSKIAVPVGVFFGTGDRILDHEANLKSLASRIAGLDVELIEGGGHMVPLSAPDRAAAFIERVALKCDLPRARPALAGRSRRSEPGPLSIGLDFEGPVLPSTIERARRVAARHETFDARRSWSGSRRRPKVSTPAR